MGFEQGTRLREHIVAGDDLAVARLLHEARREIHGVAHHGVRPPVRGPNVPNEDVAAVEADAQREVARAFDDRTHRAQHALLVVVRGLRRAGDQDHLAPVGVDVGREERDAVRARSLLHRTDERIQTFRCNGRILFEQPVDPAVVHERDRRLAVLAPERRRAGIAHACSDRFGDEPAAVQVAGVGLGRRCVPRRLRRFIQQPAAVAFLSEQLVVQPCRGALADHDLAGGRRLFHQNSARDTGAGHQQLEVRVPDEEEMEVAAVNADRHAQADESCRRRDPADLTQLRAHADRGVTAARGVVGPREEQEQGVTAELQQAAAVLIRDGEKPRERRVEDFRDFLGPDLPLPGQALRQLGETRDIDEDKGAFDRSSSLTRRLTLPICQQARDVGHQQIVRHDPPAAGGGEPFRRPG